MTDIFSDIEGKWNLNLIERLDMMTRQILLNTHSKTLPLSQFQSKFLSFSGYMFPVSAFNLMESLRELPSITVDTSSNLKDGSFSDPVIRLREHIALNEQAKTGTSAISEFTQVFEEKELISMNLSNFNKYYSQVFGKKFFHDRFDEKSSFYDMIKQTYNMWQIDQNSDGYTTDWLITIQKNVQNPSHKRTFHFLTNVILSEIAKSPQKRLYEHELVQILPNSTQFKQKYLNNPNQPYPFDQYSNTAYFLCYNSPQSICIQYEDEKPFFTLRPV